MTTYFSGFLAFFGLPIWTFLMSLKENGSISMKEEYHHNNFFRYRNNRH
ncbi:MAG: hypothetical protein Pg6C_18010 [Treponemataceae bacterium]|nr:MAG: hypothetical protein Pg6C_18010 [Treponemataceae bacterium]